MRLCRSMCGKALLFRQVLNNRRGYAAVNKSRRRSREKIRAIKRKGKAFPHIDGQSPNKNLPARLCCPICEKTHLHF
jgi:hypothetical protein